MAKAVKFEWDYNSAGELLLRSPEIATICEEEAKKMTQATGVAYESKIRVGSQRVRAYGCDQMSKEDGIYKKRKNGNLVYTQRKIED